MNSSLAWETDSWVPEALETVNVVKRLLLFIVVKYNNNKVFSFVSRCGHL